MNECFKVLDLPLVARDEAAEVLQPRVRTLDDPPAPIASQLSPVLVRGDSVVQACRDDRLNVALHQQRPCRVAVVAAVSDEPLRLVRAAVAPAPPLDLHRVERAFEELDLRRGSRLHAYSERKTRAI